MDLQLNEVKDDEYLKDTFISCTFTEMNTHLNKYPPDMEESACTLGLFTLCSISVVRSVFRSIGKAYEKAEYGCDVQKLSVYQVRKKLHQQSKQVHANGSTVKELCRCRDGLKTTDDVSIDDINELIYCICTT